MARYFYTIKVTKDMDKFGLIKGSRLTDTTSIYDPLKASFFLAWRKLKLFWRRILGRNIKNPLKDLSKSKFLRKSQWAVSI